MFLVRRRLKEVSVCAAVLVCVQLLLAYNNKKEEDPALLREVAQAQRDVIKRLRQQQASMKKRPQVTAPRAKDSPVRRKLLIAHAINPMPSGHGLHVDQDITFASLAAAKRMATTADVEQYTIEFGDDEPAKRPASFMSGGNLTRHAHDAYDMARRGLGYRKLPLLSDILTSLYEATDGADMHQENCNGSKYRRKISYERVLLAYSNADIAVQPDFYEVVARNAKAAFVINRVEVPASKRNGDLFGVADLDELYRLGKEKPQRHAGYDCFVWDRKATPFLSLYSRGLFVGYPPVGRHLKDAMACAFGPRFAEIKGQKHTFHAGDRNGGWSKFPHFEHFNRKAAKYAQAHFPKALSLRKGKNNACTKIQNALFAPPARLSLACAAQADLKARPFQRWDQPGSEWPPTPLQDRRRRRRATIRRR